MKLTKKAIFSILFVLYSLVMVWLLFGQRFGRWFPIPYWEQVRWNLNLVPFRTITEYIQDTVGNADSYLFRHAFINLTGNVIMFIPLGFFLPALWHRLRHFGRCMICGAVCIAAIELIQLFTLLGSCDVDDLILNMAGIVLGYGIYRLSFSGIFKKHNALQVVI